ncbi:Rrf2 family transcriptional regulator [candidate division WOR-3 bacterium]|nr:Rrf2 family transcriptional regulator [candidate division WOR-3 bacterium]
MQMSTRGRYALRAMFEIAMQGKVGPISLKHISKAQNISKGYIEQLFIKLRKVGLITTVRGPTGGYLLGKEPKNITIGDIIRAVESTVAPVCCVINECCDKTEKCVCHLYWEELGKHINDFLDSRTLSDICEEAKSKKLIPSCIE